MWFVLQLFGGQQEKRALRDGWAVLQEQGPQSEQLSGVKPVPHDSEA